MQILLTYNRIKLLPHDLQKQMFLRTINACFFVWDRRLLEFLYRFINHMITNPECFSAFKYTDPVEVVHPTFQQQFQREFGFDATMQTMMLVPFNAVSEWPFISDIVARLENDNPVLRECLEF